MMKKLTALFLALCLLCSLAGCGKESVRQRDEDDSPSSTARPEPPRASDVSEPEEDEPEEEPDEPEDADDAGQSEQSPDASGAPTATGDIGRTFSTMFFDYTVVSAESPDEYDGYTAQSGNKLLVVGVKVKNDFGSTLPMYDTDFQIQWGPGDNDYAWAVDAFNDKMMPLEWEIEDGDEITYDMLFEVPADQYDYSLVYLEEYTDRYGNEQTGDLYSADFTLVASDAA